MGGYSERDAARDTQASERDVNAAWHESRTQSGVREGADGDRPTRKNRHDAERLTQRVIDHAKEREARGEQAEREPRDERERRGERERETRDRDAGRGER